MPEREVKVKISAVDAASMALKKVGVEAENLGRAGQQLSVNWQQAGTAMTVAGTAIVGGFGVAARAAAEFETGMNEVATLVDTNVVSMDRLKATVNQVAKDTGQSAQTLTKGLYQAISAGVDAAKAQEFLGVAARSAVAGVTDVETAVNGLTNILNAWQMKTEDAGKVADAMFVAVKQGKTTFDELSKAIYNVAPAAASANVSMNEVLAAISTLTASGTPTAVATTQIRAALVGLQRPSEELDAVFQRLGYTNAEAALKARGLQFALSAVMEASGGSSGALQQFLGSVEAVSAAQVLAGTGAQKFKTDLEAQASAAGAADAAFEKMAASASVRYAKVREEFASIARSAGEAVLPAISALLTAVKPLLSAFSWLAQTPVGKAMFATAAGFGAVMAAVGPLIIALPSLKSGLEILGLLKTAQSAQILTASLGYGKGLLGVVGNAPAVFSAAGTAVSGFGAQLAGIAASAGPIAIAIAAIAALGIELYHLKRRWDEAAEAGKQASENFRKAVAAEDAYAARTGTTQQLAELRKARENARVTLSDRFWGAMTGGGRTAKDIAMERVAMEQAIPVAGRRAGGGPVEAGSAYIVGENGAELFVPRIPGQIIPAHRQTAQAIAPPARPYRQAGRDNNPIVIDIRLDEGLIARGAKALLASRDGQDIIVRTIRATNARTVPASAFGAYG